MTVMTYRGRPGERIEESVKNAIALAEKYNRKICLVFNDEILTVNKRLSIKHLIVTWRHMVSARRIRYKNSSTGKADNYKREVDCLERQSQLDVLMENLPTSKDTAIEWLAKWVPLSDSTGINIRGTVVIETLESIGFVIDQHVGDPQLKNKTASRIMWIEYIVGQALSMLKKKGFVHPMIGDWAKKEI